MSKIENIHYETARELFAVLTRSHALWGGIDDGFDWIFRGQRKAEWPLVASLYRESTQQRLGWLFDKACQSIPDGSFEELKALVRDRHHNHKNGPPEYRLLSAFDRIENQAVAAFAAAAEHVGLGMESDVPWNVDATRRERWPAPLMAIAQHHGVPTSLLDWTRSPRVAAYFATESAEESDTVAVWALRADLACTGLGGNSVFEPIIGLYSCSRRHSPFISAQDGLFTRLGHSFSSDHARRHGELPSLEDAIAELRVPSDAHGPVLRRLTLPGRYAVELRRLLWKERVSRPHLMPTLDNVANELLRGWRDTDGA